MDWIDKLNRWALGRIHGHRPHVDAIRCNGEGCVLALSDGGDQTIRWMGIEEIAVVKQPDLAGGSFSLAIRETGGAAITMIDDTAAGFSDFCEELPRRITGVVPYERWAVELIAGDEAGRVIFRRQIS